MVFAVILILYSSRYDSIRPTLRYQSSSKAINVVKTVLAHSFTHRIKMFFFDRVIYRWKRTQPKDHLLKAHASLPIVLKAKLCLVLRLNISRCRLYYKHNTYRHPIIARLSVKCNKHNNDVVYCGDRNITVTIQAVGVIAREIRRGNCSRRPRVSIVHVRADCSKHKKQINITIRCMSPFHTTNAKRVGLYLVGLLYGHCRRCLQCTHDTRPTPRCISRSLNDHLFCYELFLYQILADTKYIYTSIILTANHKLER